MLQRIKKFIDAQNLSSSAFANEIGVQRSSVSHVLSGRNKPSLDFVIKIKERYPEVNLDWLLSGKGGMISSKRIETEFKPIEKTEIIVEVEKPAQSSFEFNEKSVEEPKFSFEENQLMKDEPSTYYGSKKEKKIKKVILLYFDNTFEEFIP